MSIVLDKLKLFRRNKMMCEIKMDEVSEIIESTKLEVYAQSIVDLQENKVYASEYLNRPFKESSFEHPGEFYAFAANHGMIAKVDVFAIENILSRLPEQVLGKIFVNIHLSTLFSVRWEELLKKIMISYQNFVPQMVLEISEREGLIHYTVEEVEKKILALRELGFLLAIDDLGIGYSGLTNLTIIKPDYVKIDRQLVKYIDKDLYRQHLMKALVHFWNSEDVFVIVEGIERVEEAQFFANLNISFGQGYLFHKPIKL